LKKIESYPVNVLLISIAIAVVSYGIFEFTYRIHSSGGSLDRESIEIALDRSIDLFNELYFNLNDRSEELIDFSFRESKMIRIEMLSIAVYLNPIYGGLLYSVTDRSGFGTDTPLLNPGY